MASTIKPVGAHSNFSSVASAMSNASQVYAYNASGAVVTIFRLEANAASNAVLGSFVVPTAGAIVIQKENTDRVSASGTCSFAPIAETN